MLRHPLKKHACKHKINSMKIYAVLHTHAHKNLLADDPDENCSNFLKGDEQVIAISLMFNWIHSHSIPQKY